MSGLFRVNPQFHTLSGTTEIDPKHIPEFPISERLRGIELWYQAAPSWATVAMAQVIRSRLSAQMKGATLYVAPAKGHVLNRTVGSNITDAYVAEQIASVPQAGSQA